MWQIRIWNFRCNHRNGGFYSHDSLHETEEEANARIKHIYAVTNNGLILNKGYVGTVTPDHILQDIVWTNSQQGE